MSITASVLQFEVQFGKPEHNRATIEALVEQTPPSQLLVLPELAVSGYDFPDQASADALAEAFENSPTRALLTTLAKRHQATIVAGYAERAPEGLYNSAMVVQPDGRATNYRKLHLFNREQRVFLPGDAPAPVIETPAGRIGVMICFDWFFPETARSLALRGAQIIVQPANLVLPWCQRAMFARSVENKVFTITANRIGVETQAGRELGFTGQSQILSPRGETLAAAPSDAEAIITATFDPSEADDKTIAELNDLFANRRPDQYPGLAAEDAHGQ